VTLRTDGRSQVGIVATRGTAWQAAWRSAWTGRRGADGGFLSAAADATGTIVATHCAPRMLGLAPMPAVARPASETAVFARDV
jgi:hypothetical protein